MLANRVEWIVQCSVEKYSNGGAQLIVHHILWGSEKRINIVSLIVIFSVQIINRFPTNLCVECILIRKFHRKAKRHRSRGPWLMFFFGEGEDDRPTDLSSAYFCHCSLTLRVASPLDSPVDPVKQEMLYLKIIYKKVTKMKKWIKVNRRKMIQWYIHCLLCLHIPIYAAYTIIIWTVCLASTKQHQFE